MLEGDGEPNLARPVFLHLQAGDEAIAEVGVQRRMFDRHAEHTPAEFSLALHRVQPHRLRARVWPMPSYRVIERPALNRAGPQHRNDDDRDHVELSSADLES